MQPTRKLAAILCSDVVGYSRLMGDDDRATLEAIVAARQVMGQHIVRHGGRVVDATGDALLAEFQSAVEAVRCAVEIQRDFAQRNAPLPEHRRMVLRIGLDLGDVIEQDAALYGDGVNIAARLQAMGEPGGVCISGSIYDQVEGKLPLTFSFVGEQSVKNIAKPLRAYHLVVPTVVRTSRSDASGPWGATPNNLPRQLSSFVGRAADIAAILHALADHALVALHGPGGIGKTRLSLQVAAASLGGFRDGVWFVELAPLRDPALVPQAVASVLGIKEAAGRPVIEALLKFVKDRQLLLILDNCEHLVQACAELARQLLQAGQRVKLLASSREPLHVTGETSYPVPTLAAPDAGHSATLDDVTQFEAVRLFTDRAVAALPTFELTAQNAPAVASICQHLDGIPLALELAAARVRTLSVGNIATRLDNCFSVLSGGGDRTAPPRQQTLRALIDWSYDLLAPQERALFGRLSVFAGGWTLEAAEKTASGNGIDEAEVLGLLSGLVEKSLVEMEPQSGRYWLLETVRQYAQERLTESGNADPTRARHLAFYLALVEQARPELYGPEGGKWLVHLDLERENILSAHAWCDHAEGGADLGFRLAYAVKPYWLNRGLLGLGYRVTLEALARTDAQARSVARSGGLADAGQLAFFMGRYAQARQYLEQSLEIAREMGDQRRVAAVLQPLGMACLGLGDMNIARGHLQEALALAKDLGNRREHSFALNDLAQLHRMAGELDSAEPLYNKSLALARELGDRESIAIVLLNLAMVSIGRDAAARARDMLLEVLAVAQEIGSKPAAQSLLEVSAGLAALCGDWARAAKLFGAAEAQAARSGLHRDPADEAFLAPLVGKARHALGTQAFAEAETSGSALDVEAAMALARAWLESRW